MIKPLSNIDFDLTYHQNTMISYLASVIDYVFLFSLCFFFKKMNDKKIILMLVIVFKFNSHSLISNLKLYSNIK